MWLATDSQLYLLSVANEPYDIWKGLDRKSQEYQDLKVRWSVFSLFGCFLVWLLALASLTSLSPSLPCMCLFVLHYKILHGLQPAWLTKSNLSCAFAPCMLLAVSMCCLEAGAMTCAWGVQEKRCQPLWKALERVIPDIRKRAGWLLPRQCLCNVLVQRIPP